MACVTIVFRNCILLQVIFTSSLYNLHFHMPYSVMHKGLFFPNSQIARTELQNWHTPLFFCEEVFCLTGIFSRCSNAAWGGYAAQKLTCKRFPQSAVSPCCDEEEILVHVMQHFVRFVGRVGIGVILWKLLVVFLLRMKQADVCICHQLTSS